MQITDLQRDALLMTGVEENAIYQDYVSGKNDDRSGFKNYLKVLHLNFLKAR
ncbi:resolvase [Legionella beliardensis]|uniref:resolvase n=1 Tax=Legionella beliardensis TaxID=91822 RepID=UPI000E1BF048|nr:resolvase [Legionella beliardensis]